MVAQRLYDELFALPPADQEEVVRRLSERLLSNTDAGLDDDVKALLEERMADFERNPADNLTWDEAMRLVAERIAAK